MQPRRLTDSHYWPNNPRRGFETMKMAHSRGSVDAQLMGCVGAVLTLTSRSARRIAAPKLRQNA
jgi:hypothetical protein